MWFVDFSANIKFGEYLIWFMNHNYFLVADILLLNILCNKLKKSQIAGHEPANIESYYVFKNSLHCIR